MLRIEPMRVDPDDSGHDFAVEFSKQLKKYFSFLNNERSKDFCPIYHACSYLTPLQRMVLPKEKMTAIKKYLKGVYISNFFASILLVLMKNLLAMLPDQDEPVQDEPAVNFVMSGFPHISQGLEIGDSAPSSTDLDKDLKTYEKNAKDYAKNLMIMAKRRRKDGETEVHVTAPDPLSFWKIEVNK